MAETEIYNDYNSTYLQALKNPVLVYKTKILLLSWYESVIDDITDDCLLSDSSVTYQNEQGVRRTTSIKICNINHKYDIDTDTPFWSNKKIKILKGLVVGSNIYYKSLGVFVIKNSSISNDEITLECADKYCLLNGDYNTCISNYELQIPQTEQISLLSDESIANGTGLKLKSVINDMLKQDLGNGLVTDPISPIIDNDFSSIYLQKQIIINNDWTPADVIAELANTYKFSTYYDADGHFKITKDIEDNYYNLAPQWYFENGDCINLTVQNDYTKVVNVVTVQGTDTDGKIYSYTAKNNSPRSKINISLIGERKDGIVEIENGDSELKCKQYANYLLKRKTQDISSVNFECIPLLHLDINRIISITDDKNNLDRNKYVINSITFPLSVGNMSISCSDIAYLPFEEITEMNLR